MAAWSRGTAIIRPMGSSDAPTLDAPTLEASSRDASPRRGAVLHRRTVGRRASQARTVARNGRGAAGLRPCGGPSRRASRGSPHDAAAPGLMDGGRPGRLLAGTSGFAYRDWSPNFYPPGSRPDSFLRHYASRLDACELNNTYYQQPREPKVRAWLEATPEDFRFVVKAQRGGSYRALTGDPIASFDWLTPPFRLFG